MADLFSDIVSDDIHWGNPNADYPTLLGVVGGPANSDRSITKAAIIACAVKADLVRSGIDAFDGAAAVIDFAGRATVVGRAARDWAAGVARVAKRR